MHFIQCFFQHIVTCKVEVDIYKLGNIKKNRTNFLVTPTIMNVNKANLWHFNLGHINQNHLEFFNIH